MPKAQNEGTVFHKDTTIDEAAENLLSSALRSTIKDKCLDKLEKQLQNFYNQTSQNRIFKRNSKV